MTSLIPPPRLVMRSSASLLRSSSVFSANDVVGCSIAGAGVEKGEAAGAAVAVTTAGDGCGDGDGAPAAAGVCIWRATHHCQANNPITQRMTTIHAVRSIIPQPESYLSSPPDRCVQHCCSAPATARSAAATGLRRGTGSYPQPPHGWQRASRFNPSQLPRKTP